MSQSTNSPIFLRIFKFSFDIWLLSPCSVDPADSTSGASVAVSLLNNKYMEGVDMSITMSGKNHSNIEITLK